MSFVPMNRREAAAKRKSQLLSYELHIQDEDNSTLIHVLTNILFGLLSQILVNRIRSLMHDCSNSIFEGFEDFDDRLHNRSDEDEIYGRNFEILKKELTTNENSRNLSIIECLVDEGYPGYFSNKEEKRNFLANEINELFAEYRIGLKLAFFEDHYEIIRIEDTFVDSELIQPTLEVLENPIFSEARRKYFEGYKKWREGKDYGEAIRLFYETLESFLPNVYSILNNGKVLERDKGAIGKFFSWFKDTYYNEIDIDEFAKVFSKIAESFVSRLSNQKGRRHASPNPMQIPESEMILVKNMVSSLIVYFGKFIEEQGKTIKEQNKASLPSSNEDDFYIPDFSDEDIPFS
jgi:hypothetical protein